MKIHEQCTVAPPPSATQTSFTLTYFDFMCLRMPPSQLTLFYSLPPQQSDPSSFFANVLPKLKTSLSHTLHHFLPIAGNIVWPSDSPKPIVQFTPGDAVFLVVAESDAEFSHEIDYSPREAERSHPLVPPLHSSQSLASVMAFQITLFPNKGFSIGLSTNHAVIDGKSVAMFLKAWASLCQSQTDDETQIPSLVPELQPSFDRTLIKEPTNLRTKFTENLTGFLSDMFPEENSDGRCLKIPPFPPIPKDGVRATFILTRGDLEKIKRRVLSKWDVVEESKEESKSTVSSKPPTLSSFVATFAYVTVCMAKAIQGVDKEKKRFAIGFGVDWRFRLEPPVPGNYFGNCIWSNLVEAKQLAYVKEEEGVVIIAKLIHRKLKMLEEGAVLEEFSKFLNLLKEGVAIFGIIMSNRFGVYDTDFGWGKPAKVELTALPKNFIGMLDSKNGGGGIEVELVLDKPVMDLFVTLFPKGLHDD